MASFVRPDISLEPAKLTRWERQDIAKERRLRANKCELIRENAAEKLRCPLCFCLPCVIVAFILLILIGVYIVQPFVKGKLIATYLLIISLILLVTTLF